MGTGFIRQEQQAPCTQAKFCGLFRSLGRFFQRKIPRKIHTQPEFLLGFELGPCLGSGSFSQVRKACCPKSGEQVAVKIIDLSAMAAGWNNVKMNLSLEREIALLTAVSAKGHPNVLKYIEHAYTGQSLCIVTEFIEGVELFCHVQSKIRLPIPEARQIFRQLVNGVSFLHQNGVAHRDLKLENVMLVPTADWQVKIVDFGLARAFLPGELVSTRCGSEEYAAPEVIRGLGHDPRASDVWSLGVILYAMIVGVLPFNSEPGGRRALFGAICSGIVKFPSSLNLPMETRTFIHALLQADPVKRLTVEQILANDWLQGK
jgi:serine/threonine protein kinase